MPTPRPKISFRKTNPDEGLTVIDRSTGETVHLDVQDSRRVSELVGNKIAENPRISAVTDRIKFIPGIRVTDPVFVDRRVPIQPTVPLPTVPFPTVPFPTIPLPTVPQPNVPQPTTPPTNAEIDTNLQILLSSIPIADPGNIITSEYHNALRDAVRALASRIGLSVNPVAEFKILTFAPNFIKSPPSKVVGAANVPDAEWDVFFDRAAIPANVNIVTQAVKGGFIVQLPDNADIYQMTVHGEKLDKDKPQPKNFKVRLNRLEFGKDKPLTLIDIELESLKDGIFEESDVVKLSSAELDTITVNRQANIDERKSVSNADFLYFVTAEWFGGVENAAKSNIHSIQIFCRV